MCIESVHDDWVTFRGISWNYSAQYLLGCKISLGRKFWIRFEYELIFKLYMKLTEELKVQIFKNRIKQKQIVYFTLIIQYFQISLKIKWKISVNLPSQKSAEVFPGAHLGMGSKIAKKNCTYFMECPLTKSRDPANQEDKIYSERSERCAS